MTRTAARNILTYSTLLIVACVAFWAITRTGNTSSQLNFLSTSLSEAHAREDVVIGDISYEIVGNLILPEESAQNTDSSQKLEIMRLAYAKTLARRNPLFGLAGVDLQALEQAVERLITLREKLAALQDHERDKEAVVNGLYPTNFLTAIVKAELARRAFLSEGSVVSEREYHQALEETVRSFVADLDNYKKAYNEMTPDDFGYIMLSGAVTKQSTLRTIQTLEKKALDAELRLDSRRKCLRGNIAHCDKHSLLFPSPYKGISIESDTQDMPTSTLEIVDILKQQRNSTSDPDAIIAFNESACIPTTSSEKKTKIFITQPQLQDNSFPTSIFYVGDLFFLPLPKSGSLASTPPSTQDYLAEHGLLFQPYDPLKFYMCPSIGIDYGRAFGTIAAVQFLQRHQAIADGSHLQSPSGVLYADNVALFLREHVVNLLTDPNVSKEAGYELTEISLALREHTSGFEYVVQQIVHVGEGEVRIYKIGVPLQMSAIRLLSTQSGFPSLFLPYAQESPSDERVMQTQMFESDYRHTELPLKRWSELSHAVLKEDIVRTLRLFREFHQSPSGLQ